MKTFKFNALFSSGKARRMRITIFIIAGLLILLASPSWAQEATQTSLDSSMEFSNTEKSTIIELITVDKKGGGGGAGTCTIIPWFCDYDD